MQAAQRYFLFNANYGTANIMIRLPFTLGVGVHDIPSSGAAVIYTTMTTQYGNNQVGTLEITSKTSERITGKFNVTAQNSSSESITLSNGTFSFSILQ